MLWATPSAWFVQVDNGVLSTIWISFSQCENLNFDFRNFTAFIKIMANLSLATNPDFRSKRQFLIPVLSYQHWTFFYLFLKLLFLLVTLYRYNLMSYSVGNSGWIDNLKISDSLCKVSDLQMPCIQKRICINVHNTRKLQQTWGT